MYKTRVYHLAALVMAMDTRASLTTRLECARRICDVADRNQGVAALGAALNDCGTLASKCGEWYLAATLRRAQTEIVHSFMPTPGANIRKIFRKKRKVA